MPKGGPRIRVTTARGTKRCETLEAWMAAQFRADPGLRRRVNALLREMLAEQAAAARREQKKGRARKARAQPESK